MQVSLSFRWSCNLLEGLWVNYCRPILHSDINSVINTQYHFSFHFAENTFFFWIVGCVYKKVYKWNGPRSHLGPWSLWSPQNSVPTIFFSRKIGPCLKMQYNDFHAGTKFLAVQISNFLGSKFLGDQKSKLAQMGSGTISVIAW